MKILRCSITRHLTHAARAMAGTLTNKERALRYSAIAVVVKTLALPTVVRPPPAGTTDAWRSGAEPGSTASRTFAPDGRRLGFTLNGAANSYKQEMLKAMQRG